MTRIRAAVDPAGHTDGMFERFTDRTRQVIIYAHEQATAHLLIGILAFRDDAVRAGSASTGPAPPEAVVADGIDPAAIRASIDEPVTVREGHLPFSPAAKKVLEFALREAIQRAHADIDVRHVLLALLREETGADLPRLLVITRIDVAVLRCSTEESLREYPPRPGP